VTEGDTDRTETERRLTVTEAADALRITSEAVRTRLSRGTLRSVREHGRVYVLLDPDITQPNDDRTKDQTALVDELRDRVAFLERELETRTEENRRKDHLLAAALERIPALVPPPEAPESPDTPSEPVPGSKTPPEAETAPERVPWWRRMFGG
jgi:hypothetical protein